MLTGTHDSQFLIELKYAKVLNFNALTNINNDFNCRFVFRKLVTIPSGKTISA